MWYIKNPALPSCFSFEDSKSCAVNGTPVVVVLLKHCPPKSCLSGHNCSCILIGFCLFSTAEYYRPWNIVVLVLLNYIMIIIYFKF